MENRVIKFRAKRLDNCEWVYGYYATFDLTESGENKNTPVVILENSFYADYEYLDKFYKIANETLGQFTGLYDKNGKEIYEGDIIQIINGKSIVDIDYSTLFHITHHTVEVIGNIYDNHELLEASK